MILRFYENPFMGIRLSSEDFNELGNNHLDYLKKNNTNKQLDPVISVVEQAVIAHDKWFNEKGAVHSSSSSETIEVIMKRHELEEAADEIYDEAVYKFKKKNPVLFEELFQNGKSPFNHLNNTNTVPTTESLLKVCAKHTNDISVNLVHDLQTKLDEYKGIAKDKNDSRTEVVEDSHEGSVYRVNLAKAMFHALIKLLDIHFDDLEAINKYYDAKFLNYYINKYKNSKKTPPPPAEPN